MNQKELLADHFTQMIEIARFAPSVHNTQPWLVSLTDEALVIAIDPAHRLGDGDPTGRETFISLGIFCEALAIAARDFDLTVSNAVLLSDSIQLTFVKAAPFTSNDVALLKKRHSDRSIYTPANIGDSVIERLQASVAELPVTAHIVTDADALETIAELTSRGINLALSSPGFRHELGNYLVAPWSRKKRGIATDSLYLPRLIGALQPTLMKRGLGLNKEAALEKRRWQSASAVIALTAAGDMPKYWLDVGRAYLRVSLAITDLGLAQATSAAVVEASNYNEDVSELLGTQERVLSLIRVGTGSTTHHYSPRVAASDLITSN